MRKGEKSELMKWSRELKAAAVSEEETPDEGFYTTVELSEKLGLALPTTRGQILRLMRAGKVEVRKFRRRSGTRVMRISHYRIIDQNLT